MFLAVCVGLAVVASKASIAAAFVPAAHSVGDSTTHFHGKDQRHRSPSTTTLSRFNRLNVQQKSPRQPSTQLNSFMGSDGGILGIGTPELVSFDTHQIFGNGNGSLFSS
jgi:hypothetical protein